MSDSGDLFELIASTIHAGEPTILWNAAGTYAAGATGIFLKLMPTAPDRVVVLNLVNQGDALETPSGQWMLQVRGRGLPNRPTDVDDLLDSIFPLLHGATYLTHGTTTITQIIRRVSVQNGQDDSKRFERIDQYYLDVSVAPSALRPF